MGLAEARRIRMSEFEDGDFAWPLQNSVPESFDRHLLFVDMNNDGHLVLTDIDLDRLTAAGFTNRSVEGEESEVYFHPHHWKVVDPTRVHGTVPVEHAATYDFLALPLSQEAKEWGRSNYGDWRDGAP